MNQKLLLLCLPLFAQMLHLAPAQTLQNQWLKNMNKGYETYPADIQISQTGNVVASLPMIYLDSVNQNHTKAGFS